MVERAERVERTQEVANPAPAAETAPAAAPTQTTRQVTETRVSGSVLAARVIWYIAGVVEVLLGFRFVLALLGANPSNGFANFIYNVSHPFVAPFFSLFGYHLHYGVSRFEVYTLIAMAIYAIIAWGLVRLVTIGRPSQPVVA